MLPERHASCAGSINRIVPWLWEHAHRVRIVHALVCRGSCECSNDGLTIVYALVYMQRQQQCCPPAGSSRLPNPCPHSRTANSASVPQHFTPKEQQQVQEQQKPAINRAKKQQGS
jgi:hypothetical protein